ncbi:MAG: PQQ-binding-like beta-propeller repeat protein [Phycisphaerales bacterium]
MKNQAQRHPSTRAHAALLAACAGLAFTHPAPAQPPAPPPPQPAAPKPAPTPRAFLDEAVSAPDAMVRAKELADAGNFTEAVRVLQEALENEGRQVMRSPSEPELYLSVRHSVHALLLHNPVLLEKYRAEQDPIARSALDQGDVEHVRFTRFLTAAGLEAAARTAQEQLEAARFEAARMTLAETLQHPDCRAEKATDLARTADLLRAYLPRPDTEALAAALANKAGVAPPAPVKPVTPPAAERTRGTGPFDSFPMPPWDQLSAQPLQSVALATQPEDRRQWAQESNPDAPWVFPTLADETLFVADDQSIAAYDAATLAQMWRTTPSKVLPLPAPTRGEYAAFANQRVLEDISSPAVARGTVVAITGLPVSGDRQGDGRIHALRASDGALLWSVSPRYTEDALDSGVLRGQPVIDADTVVVGVRKPGTLRRVISLYLVGIDLTSGQVRWNRLVGSVGAQVWGRSQARADASTLSQGVVYRGDDMGVLGAFSAATGETLWVRQAGNTQPMDPNLGVMMPEEAPAFAVQKPVVIGASVFFVEPGDNSVIEVDTATGALKARRKAAEVGSPDYLVQVGDRLALIARSGLCFLPAARFATAAPEPAATDKFDRPVQFTGRAVAMGDSLCVPTASGVVLIDSLHPDQSQAHALPRTGNIVVPLGAGAENIAHAVVADNAGVHTFLSWEKAKATLEARVARDPANPIPVLTYLQLALRQGKADLAPSLADRALALIQKAPDSAQNDRARSDLFDLLHASITASRTALTPQPSTTITAPPTEFPLPALKDAALLTTLADRLQQAAQTPRQRALALFDRAFLRSFVQRHDSAVEDLQEVLADPALALLPGADLDVPGANDSGATAGSLATAAIADILLTAGPAPYRAFDDEAAGVLAAQSPTASAAELADTARRYALAAVAPSMWSRAADAASREKKTGLTRECLARGAESVIISRRIGRDPRPQDASALAAGLLAGATNTADQEPTLMLLSRLAAAAPDTTANGPQGTTPLADALTPLRQAIALRAGRAAIGPAIGERVQALEQWRPAVSLQAGRPGEATSLVPMVTRNADRVAVFAPSLSDGRLAPLWQRDCDVTPTFVRVSTDATILFYPRTTDPTLEAVSNADGSTLWKTPAIAPLFGEAAARNAERVARINTPLDGLVRSDDLLFAGTPDTLVLARRDAFVLALNLKDGRPAWHAALPMDRVFDLDCAQGLVCAVGGKPNDTIREALEPAAAALDLSTGQLTWRAPTESLGEHARWIRVLPDGGALLGSSDKVLRLSARGAVSWSNATRPMRNTGCAWLCGTSAFILDDAYDLRLINLATGEGPEHAMDDMGRLHLPFEVRATREHLAVSSEEGVIVLDNAGEITGIDAIETPGAMAPAILCDNALVTIQVFPREDNGATIRSAAAEARVLIFSFPDAKLLAQRRISLLDDPESIRVSDGKLLIDQGSFTSVVDIRP